MLREAPPGPGPEEKDEGRSGDSVTGLSDGHSENRSQQMLGSSLESSGDVAPGRRSAFLPCEPRLGGPVGPGRGPGGLVLCLPRCFRSGRGSGVA